MKRKPVVISFLDPDHKGPTELVTIRKRKWKLGASLRKVLQKNHERNIANAFPDKEPT